jgi:hypothetical protein
MLTSDPAESQHHAIPGPEEWARKWRGFSGRKQKNATEHRLYCIRRKAEYRTFSPSTQVTGYPTNRDVSSSLGKLYPGSKDLIEGTLKCGTLTRVKRVIKDVDGHFFVEFVSEICCTILKAATAPVAVTVQDSTPEARLQGRARRLRSAADSSREVGAVTAGLPRGASRIRRSLRSAKAGSEGGG